MNLKISRLVLAPLTLGLIGAAPAPTPVLDPLLAWAYPGRAPYAPSTADDDQALVGLPGVTARLKRSETQDVFHAADWRPNTHPLAPPVVLVGRAPRLWACGYCHLPAGEGRPENAALAGLPRDYIIRQVGHFAAGERVSAQDGWKPTAFMTEVAQNATPTEVSAAADYFSRLPFTSHVHVVEAANVARPHPINFLFAPEASQPLEPLGQRIVEAPASMDRFELRDSWVGFTAYVPVGSLKRGAALAETQACAGCHGAGLKGGAVGPPLAGRSPSYLFRQLLAFQTGARGGPDAAPMRAVTAPLSAPDMIALAAYAGSRRR